MAHRIGQALEDRGGRCTILGSKAVIGQLTGASGIIAIAPPPPGPAADRAEAAPDHGLARWLTRFLRHVPQVPCPPRCLCILTRTHFGPRAGTVRSSADHRLTDLLHTNRTHCPRLRITHIDLDGATDPATVVGDILAEAATEEVITWRNGQRRTDRPR
ncbi:hypothetical protein [Streptomyces chrestomyceticus]|uniref:hypothetical protein n=1 Tax=Streptomyces chrestomyceticus TaxID=68185 RepID=UPI0019D2AAF1|nr:hypothetical protein [Streptomyces chrestomyceticus]